MIELRKRVLSSEFVVLEYKQLNCQFTDGKPDTSLPPVWSYWKPVPYVNEAGEPIDNTGEINEADDRSHRL